MSDRPPPSARPAIATVAIALTIVVALLGAFYTGVQLVLTIAYGFPVPAVGYGIGLLASVALGVYGIRRALRR